MSTTNVWHWSREIARRLHKDGISLRFEPDAETAFTDGGTIVIPTPPADASETDLKVLRGLVIHEVGHLARPEAFAIAERHRLKNGSNIHALMNIVEDRCQERENSKEFVGDRLALDFMQAEMNRRQIKSLAKITPEAVAAMDVERTAKLCAAGIVAIEEDAAEWMPRTAAGLPAVEAAMDRLLDGRVSPIIDDLRREGWGSRVRAASSPSEAWEVAKALHKRLFPDDPEPKDHGAPEKSKAHGKGDKAKAEERGKAEDAGSTKKSIVPWELILRSDHGQEPAAGSPGESTIDWAGKNQDGAVEWFTEEEVEIPAAGGRAVNQLGRIEPRYDLVQETRRLLQAKARCAWRSEKLEGRLAKRNVTRLIMPQVGDGTFNRQVFEKREAGLNLNTVVQLLVDSSGSMSGRKFKCAAEAALGLYEMVQLGLRCPVEVLGFTHYDTPHYYVYKAFSEMRATPETIVSRMSQARLNGNADGDALLWAFDRIKAQTRGPRGSAPRRVMVVLSDGNPAEAAGGDPDSALKAAVKIVRRSGVAEVYGIGIMDANVRRYYSPTAPVIHRPEDIGPALLETLRDVMQSKIG